MGTRLLCGALMFRGGARGEGEGGAVVAFCSEGGSALIHCDSGSAGLEPIGVTQDSGAFWMLSSGDAFAQSAASISGT